jgi:tRNA-2-methylthio-N6-dimethylallyladenosine synthase
MNGHISHNPETGCVYIRTFGCQMNEYDSQRMAGLLALSGYRPVSDPERADIIIINTCSIREKPEEKTYSDIGKYRLVKEKKPELIIVVSGCVAQQRGGEIIERFPHVDLVLGTHQINRIDDLISDIRNKRRRRAETDICRSPYVRPFPRMKDRYSAYVTIMQGCNNWCSYCIVPLVRGAELSRPAEEIMSEIRQITEEGFIEVTLLGQNVNSYRDPSNGLTFSGLLDRVAEIDTIRRIRFTTSHPKDLSDGLIERYRNIDVLCSHIHLPVQSGSNRILDLMNRGYTREQYIEKIKRLREARPDISVTTDIIVGFPGETEIDFEQTLGLMNEVVFDGAYSFKYSPRPGTAAALLANDVSEADKGVRLSILQDLQKKHTLARNSDSVNGIEEVLAVGSSVKDPREITGRSRQNKVVNFKGARESVGTLVPVKIIRANNNSLWGEEVGNPGRRC